MAIDKELLNAMLVAYEVHTGVYLSKERRVAVVVKVTKDGKVFYLTRENCTVEVRQSHREKFLVDYPVELYHYPTLRGVRQLAADIVKYKFAATHEARQIIRSILA